MYQVHSEESPIMEKLSVEAYRLQMEQSALHNEIEEAEQFLAAWNITFTELIRICPKQRRTRAKCLYIAALILKNEKWYNELLKKNRIPKSDICREYDVSEKFLEKFRKHIAALCLVQGADYPIMHTFLTMSRKRGVENE